MIEWATSRTLASHDNHKLIYRVTDYIFSHKNSYSSCTVVIQGSEFQVHCDWVDEASDIRRRRCGCVQSLRQWHRRGDSQCRSVVVLLHKRRRLSRIRLPSSGRFFHCTFILIQFHLHIDCIWILLKIKNLRACFGNYFTLHHKCVMLHCSEA